jgi:hypothetical protein
VREKAHFLIFPFLTGSGMVIESTMDVYDEQEKTHYCSMVSKSFVRGYGGWNVRTFIRKNKIKKKYSHVLFYPGTQGPQGCQLYTP